MLFHFCRFHVNCQFCRCHCHFLEKIAMMRFLFIFVKLTIESRNIELFCTQFNSRVYSLIHIILMFFLCGAATINFTLSFHAYFDYNHLE
jgi:hypothetical protein